MISRQAGWLTPFDLRVPTKRAYFLATHPYREKPERMRCFEDWILSEAAIVETRLAVPAA